jgi:hypothetical protein
MWPIREIRIMDSGEGKSHKPARRTHMRTGRSVWRGLTTTTGIMRQFDSSGARRAQRLVEDPRAGYDPGLEFEFPQTVPLKACALLCRA